MFVWRNKERNAKQFNQGSPAKVKTVSHKRATYLPTMEAPSPTMLVINADDWNELLHRVLRVESILGISESRAGTPGSPSLIHRSNGAADHIREQKANGSQESHLPVKTERKARTRVRQTKGISVLGAEELIDVETWNVHVPFWFLACFLVQY